MFSMLDVALLLQLWFQSWVTKVSSTMEALKKKWAADLAFWEAEFTISVFILSFDFKSFQGSLGESIKIQF